MLEPMCDHIPSTHLVPVFSIIGVCMNVAIFVGMFIYTRHTGNPSERFWRFRKHSRKSIEHIHFNIQCYGMM
jgi:hypothetical protein